MIFDENRIRKTMSSMKKNHLYLQYLVPEGTWLYSARTYPLTVRKNLPFANENQPTLYRVPKTEYIQHNIRNTKMFYMIWIPSNSPQDSKNDRRTLFFFDSVFNWTRFDCQFRSILRRKSNNFVSSVRIRKDKKFSCSLACDIEVLINANRDSSSARTSFLSNAFDESGIEITLASEWCMSCT